MREKFETIHELFGYYQYLKLHVVSQKSLLPRTVRLPSGEFSLDPFPASMNAFAVRANREEEFALIGDVKLFILRDYWQTQFRGPRGAYKPALPDHLLMIFHFRFCSALSPYRSYGELARAFRRLRKTDPRVPSALFDEGNLCRHANAIKDQAEKHFIAKGYLEPPAVEARPRMASPAMNL